MSPAARVRVAIADDNPVLRFGLRTVLEAAGDIEIVAEAVNGNEAVNQARQQRPDVLLLDVRMPLMDGLATIPEISQLTKVVVLTCVDDPATVTRAVAAGARGYVVHGEFELSELTEIVRETAKGRSFLSPPAAAALVNGLQEVSSRGPGQPDGTLTRREHEIMELIADGLSNRQIAASLVLSEKTVKNHICSIYHCLGVSGRSQAVSRWRQTGPLSLARLGQEAVSLRIRADVVQRSCENRHGDGPGFRAVRGGTGVVAPLATGQDADEKP
jgi:DNA-binding NarL/FixJ family response regulator